MFIRQVCLAATVAVATLVLAPPPVLAEDWPMWRHDATRSAASQERLPENLTGRWRLEFPKRVPAWEDPFNQDLMPFDMVFEPVVFGDLMYVGFNDKDKIVAYDLATGSERWTFYTNGPVRFPPAVASAGVYVCSDDGYLYCLDPATGTLRWKYRGGPSEKKVIGNQRIISMWPARGGAVLRDGKVYFAASIWPFMGTFIYALDAETGQVDWVNDRTSAQYIKQPHSAVSFAGVAPQGAMAATQDTLLVPGGRSVPAAFDRATGEFLHFHINDGGKGTGGSQVLATDSEFYVHTNGRGMQAFDLRSGVETKFECTEPVLDGGYLYSYDSEKKQVRAFNAEKKQIWAIQADASGDLIKAGPRLYAAGAGAITVVRLPHGTEDAPAVERTLPVEGQVRRLLAANGTLVAVTLEGAITAYGRANVPAKAETSAPAATAVGNKPVERARALIAAAGTDAGYALFFGIGNGALLRAFAQESGFHCVGVDPDSEKVAALRAELDALGLYGTRIALHVGEPLSFEAPPYIANLIVVNRSLAGKYARGTFAETLFNSVRPYGGMLWYGLQEGAALEAAFPGKVEAAAGGQRVRRAGPLEGAGTWSHHYGNIANTLKSDDRLVKLPLGVLWFGGSSHLDVLPRHAHGPSELVGGGRLFIEGMDSISARDVYTGRVLWTRRFEGLDTYGVYYTYAFDGDLLSTAYSTQAHYPGANARGTNFVLADDALYTVMGTQCYALDPATGDTLRVFEIPATEGRPREWGFIGVYEDLLLAGADFARYSEEIGKPTTESPEKEVEEKDYAPITDLSASKGLIAFDRHTGDKLWEVAANYAFYHNGIVAGHGRVYCLDRLPEFAEAKLRRRGSGSDDSYRVAAFDADSGELLWERADEVFGSWLSYSEERDIVFQGGARASDRANDLEIGEGMVTLRGATGEVVWKRTDLKYAGPCILHGDMIITNPDQYGLSTGAYRLADGSEVRIANPITGIEEPWRIQRGKGCNYVIASEHLLAYRDGAAAYYDLDQKIGTGNLGGFKTGCSSALVAADGVLNAPDYTRTCVCLYQNQTSLGLVHMPEVETWTDSQYANDFSGHGAVQRVGINFGAPGDRMDENGMLWLEWPAVGGPSPSLGIAVEAEDPEYFLRHSSAAASSKRPWVAASGIKGMRQVRVSLATDVPVAGNDWKDYGKGKSRTPSAPAGSEEDRVPPGGLYTVRLHLPHADALDGEAPVFDVAIADDHRVIRVDLSASGETAAPVREWKNVHLENTLAMHFTPVGKSEPVVCGIEIVKE